MDITSLCQNHEAHIVGRIENPMGLQRERFCRKYFGLNSFYFLTFWILGSIFCESVVATQHVKNPTKLSQGNWIEK